MTNEAIISEFLRTAYTDEKLAALLAHAEDGKLSWHSCCCLRGIPTANHALRGMNVEGAAYLPENHGDPIVKSPLYTKADTAYFNLAGPLGWTDTRTADAHRRTKLIPLIKAEMKRREAERSVVHVTEAVCA